MFSFKKESAKFNRIARNTKGSWGRFDLLILPILFMCLFAQALLNTHLPATCCTRPAWQNETNVHELTIVSFQKHKFRKNISKHWLLFCPCFSLFLIVSHCLSLCLSLSLLSCLSSVVWKFWHFLAKNWFPCCNFVCYFTKYESYLGEPVKSNDGKQLQQIAKTNCVW